MPFCATMFWSIMALHTTSYSLPQCLLCNVRSLCTVISFKVSTLTFLSHCSHVSFCFIASEGFDHFYPRRPLKYLFSPLSFQGWTTASSPWQACLWVRMTSATDLECNCPHFFTFPKVMPHPIAMPPHHSASWDLKHRGFHTKPKLDQHSLT